jgi:hypothetical protein
MTTKRTEYAWLIIALERQRGVDYGNLAPRRVLVGKPGGCLNRDGMGLQMSKRLKVAEYVDCLRR